MKIAGKIIRECNIKTNTEERFEAVYRHHSICISLLPWSVSKYFIDVLNKDGTEKLSRTVNRFNIRDAIVFALENVKFE